MKQGLMILLAVVLTACAFSSSSPVPPTAVARQTAAAPVPTSSDTPFPPTVTAVPSPRPTEAEAGNPWWNDAVFYEIYVRGFYDSNGDGIGDLNGLIEKLDYLNDGRAETTTDLGITGIWLMPIHPSPSVHGYDVTDYYAINPQYGTMDDFRRLVDTAHRRGIRIIIDLVLNHTSSQHPWFVQSQDPRSAYREWYIWSDSDPGFKGPWNQQVWHPWQGDYYYGYFWEGMPDLNYATAAVTEEMQQVTRFWLEDVGVDGFRLDAIGALIEQGNVTVETSATHDWLARYFSFYKSVKPDALTIGEVWAPDDVVIPYVVNREVDLAFEFDLSAAMLASVNDESNEALLKTLRSRTRRFPKGQYGTFLANHDMTRVMTQLGDRLDKARTAASLYFALPGVPFIFYGEEIGMAGKASGLMQWSGAAHAGFSTAAPWQPPDSGYPTANVALELDDPNSLLAHYRSLISLRGSHPALRTGELFLLSTLNTGLFACLRTSADEAVLVLVNLTGSPIRDYSLFVPSSTLPAGDYVTLFLMGEGVSTPLTVLQGGRIQQFVPLPEIPPRDTFVLLLQAE